MKKRILSIFCVFVMVMLTGCSGASAAEETANNFFENFKEENYYEMGSMSKYHTPELINKYVGINIIDYSIKSTKEYKVKHTIEVHNNDDDELFDTDKSVYEYLYPDYEVTVDNETDWTIQSKEENILEYIIVFDVEYSDLAGDTKQNSVTLAVTQEEPGSDDYIVSEIIGIINPYADI